MDGGWNPGVQTQQHVCTVHYVHVHVGVPVHTVHVYCTCTCVCMCTVCERGCMRACLIYSTCTCTCTVLYVYRFNTCAQMNYQSLRLGNAKQLHLKTTPFFLKKKIRAASGGTRTRDILHTRQTLYQLSHRGSSAGQAESLSVMQRQSRLFPYKQVYSISVHVHVHACGHVHMSTHTNMWRSLDSKQPTKVSPWLAVLPYSWYCHCIVP